MGFQRFTRAITNKSGRLLPGVPITVQVKGTGTNAVVYGDSTGSTLLPNPLLSDQRGMISVWLEDTASYVLQYDADAEPLDSDLILQDAGLLQSIADAANTAATAAQDAAAAAASAIDAYATLEAAVNQNTSDIGDNAALIATIQGDIATLEADVTALQALSHTQGTDQGLDTGGPNASTALEIRDHLDLLNIHLPVNDSGEDALEVWSSQKIAAEIAASAASGGSAPATYATAHGFGMETLTDAANISWDLDDAQAAQVTLGGNRTLDNPSNIRDGFTYLLVVVQDGTGSRTLAFDTAFKFPGGTAPTLSTAAGSIDVLTFVAHGGSLLCVPQTDFQ